MNKGAVSPNTSIPLIIGVTGHRNLVDAEISLLEARVESFFTQLTKQFPDLPLLLLSPLAEGADRLVVRVAHRLGIAITVVLPMPRAAYQIDFDEASLSIFDGMLTYAEVIELPLLPKATLADIAVPGQGRDGQYEFLGVYLAAHSHILLAMWDGKPSAAPGGTAHVVQFHQTDEIEIFAGTQHRSPIDFSEDESDLVYHIACSREDKGCPVNGIQAGDIAWLSRDDLEPRTATLPSRYVSVFERQAAFQIDFGKITADQPSEPLANFSQEPNRNQLDDIHSLYQHVDQMAIRFQKKAIRSLRWMFAFIALTGLSFIAYADFSGFDFGIYFYLFFMSLAIGLYLLEKRGEWYRKFLDYRVLAEALRVQFFWALAGVRADNPSQFSHDQFMKRQDLEVGWIRNVLRYAGRRADAMTNRATADGLNATIERWVGNEKSGQLGYYRQRAKDRTRRSRITGWLGSVSFALGLILAIVLAVGMSELRLSAQNLFIALMGALPFIAAVRQSFAHRIAERELIAQYTYMERIFSNAQRLLTRADSDAERREILRALGEAAMEENGLWILRQRERPLSGGQVFQGS